MLDPEQEHISIKASCKAFVFHTMNYKTVLESQLSGKIVNLMFQLVKVSNKLTILWGT